MNIEDTVILLQIVMVSPGTHLVSPELRSPSLKKSPKLKMLGPLCNQTVNLKTLYYSILNL